MLKIRRVEMEDNPALAGIIRGVLQSYGAVGEGYAYVDWSTDNMFEAYTKPRCAYWVIEQNGEVKGGGGFSPLEGEAGVCEIQKMYFLPEIRGKGLGKKIIQLCLVEATKLEYKKTYLETLPNMSEALKLYASFGFERLQESKGSTGHYKCNVWMMRDL